MSDYQEYNRRQSDERFRRNTEAYIRNMQGFVDSLRACVENAAASPTGRCEEHRHGRPFDEWEAR